MLVLPSSHCHLSISTIASSLACFIRLFFLFLASEVWAREEVARQPLEQY
jgi:hypothetical protein